MLKKVLLTGVLGVVLASGAAFACVGDACQVSNPNQVHVGLDLKLDIDVCVDAGNLFSNIMGAYDYWSVKAVIYQGGQGNEAIISQNSVDQTAGIVQTGSSDEATITQTGSKDYAFIYQFGGSGNTATITQSLANAAALIVQSGSGNTATINQ